MAKIFQKHLYIVLVVSLTANLAGLFFWGREIYFMKYPVPFDYLSSEKYSSILNDNIPPEIKEIDKRKLFNSLVERFGYTTYLEIGQGKAEHNLKWIKCNIKVGVDPDPECNASYCITSDEFFNINQATFDLIFIDGLHHADQAFRDIENALNCLNKNGTIVVHDCNPADESMQVVPRRQPVWTGDVWKAWVKLRSERNDLEMFVVDNDSGFGVIRRGLQETIDVPEDPTYRMLTAHRSDWLNLKSIGYFLDYLRIN